MQITRIGANYSTKPAFGCGKCDAGKELAKKAVQDTKMSLGLKTEQVEKYLDSIAPENSADHGTTMSVLQHMEPVTIAYSVVPHLNRMARLGNALKN